jgi:cleavage and polyadenylation specificity factor subunit 3
MLRLFVLDTDTFSHMYNSPCDDEQELLLILDEYWQANPQLQHIPIWYASKLASRALRVYQTYSNMMNARIRSQMDVANPFSFKFIQNLKSIDVNSFDDTGPSVVFASPGMLQSGVSRQLFDRWAGDPKNGVLIAGYGKSSSNPN